MNIFWAQGHKIKGLEPRVIHGKVYLGLNNGKYYARPIESFLEMVKNSEGEVVSRFVEATAEEAEQFLSDKRYDSFCDFTTTEQEKS